MNITLNGSNIPFKYGIPIVEKLNEDLDTGSLIIPHVEELSIEPLDEIVITDDTYTKYMLVSDIRRTITKFTIPREYNYYLTLISPTIQLQRIVLPNRSVTQPLTGTKTSIYTVLSQYVSLYTDFTISTALQTLTTGVDCPEFQWNRPTLFEVINDLLSEVDAVVSMTSFTEIGYLDLNIDGDAIDDDGLSNEILSQTLQEYANKIECEVENAIVPYPTTRVVEWVGVKSDDDVLVTTDNAKIILEHTIDKFDKVELLVGLSNDEYINEIFTIDITSYVIEKTKHDLTLPSNTLGIVVGNYKRDRVYYERGNNKIEGLTYNEDSWLGTSTLKAILNIYDHELTTQTGNTVTLTNSDILNVYMRVEYQTQDTVKFVSNKDKTYLGLTTGDKLTMINNQDTSYVDFPSFANKQQQTVDRIGNPQLELQGKYTLSNMPKLGDIRNLLYKLYYREYTINENFVKFKGFASENYVLKNLYTGLKQQRRFTSIALGSEALECNHIQEIAFNLSKQGSTLSLVSELIGDSDFENYMLKFGIAGQNVNLVRFKTNESVDIGVTPSIYYTNNSILLSFKMADNFSAGLQRTDDVSTNLQNYVSYVDDNGNFTSFVYYLYTKYSIYDRVIDGIFPSTVINKMPELDTTLLDDDYKILTMPTIYRYKDNREITVETAQYNFASQSGIFYGKEFFSKNPMIYTESTDIQWYVAYSNTETYEDGDQTIKGTIAPLTSLTFTRTNNQITVTSPDSSIDPETVTSWAICDSSGNIVIAVNN